MSNGSGGGRPGVKLEYDGKLKLKVFEDTNKVVVEITTANGEIVTTTLSLDTGKAV